MNDAAYFSVGVLLAIGLAFYFKGAFGWVEGVLAAVWVVLLWPIILFLVIGTMIFGAKTRRKPKLD